MIIRLKLFDKVPSSLLLFSSACIEKSPSEAFFTNLFNVMIGFVNFRVCIIIIIIAPEIATDTMNTKMKIILFNNSFAVDFS